jgi:hypothetical protein
MRAGPRRAPLILRRLSRAAAWVATGTYSCSALDGTGWLVVTIGTKSTPQIPVQCG